MSSIKTLMHIFREYLTGFHKRKLERRQKAQDDIKAKIRKEKSDFRREVSTGIKLVEAKPRLPRPLFLHPLFLSIEK